MSKRNKLGVLLLAITMIGVFTLPVIFGDATARVMGLALIALAVFIGWVVFIVTLIFGGKYDD